MRVVFDTNVLVSGVLSEVGPPGLLLELALAGELEPSFDARILGEYREVLGRKELALPPDVVADLLSAFERIGREVVASPWPRDLPDRDDEPFLAVAAMTDSVLVTGNLRHFPARARGGVEVLTPRTFLDRLRARRDEAP